MARVRVPTNVSGVGSITLSTSGALTPDASGIITCTADEATFLTHPNNRVAQRSSNGAINWRAGGVIIGISINGKAQAPAAAGGTTSANGLNALDVANFFSTTPEQHPFWLVQG